MNAYICGKMRGLPSYNFPAFMAAEAALEALGYTCFNPARKDIEAGFDPDKDDPKTTREYMKADLPAVLESDVVVCLDGWQMSEKGAPIEVFVALSCGIPVLDYPDLKPMLPWPAYEAFWTSYAVMQEGALKHPKNSWLFEDANRHAMKSARHALTWMSIKDGHQEPDGEDHSRMMLCRAAMVVAQRKMVTRG